MPETEYHDDGIFLGEADDKEEQKEAIRQLIMRFPNQDYFSPKDLEG